MMTRVVTVGVALALAACDEPPDEAGGASTMPPRESAPERSVSQGGGGGPEPSSASPKARTRPPADRKPVEAEAVEGRPGFVLSPYTGEAVDIRGIMPGTVIDDPGAAEGSGK